MIRSASVKAAMALPRRRFSGEQAKTMSRPGVSRQKLDPDAPGGADGQLRRNEHHRPVREVVQHGQDTLDDGAHVGAVLVVHGGVVGHPQQAGFAQGHGRVGGEAKPPAGDAGGEEVVEAGLQQRRATRRQARDALGVIQAGDLQPERGEAGRGDAAQMPQSRDGNLHGAVPMMDGLATR